MLKIMFVLNERRPRNHSTYQLSMRRFDNVESRKGMLFIHSSHSCTVHSDSLGVPWRFEQPRHLLDSSRHAWIITDIE